MLQSYPPSPATLAPEGLLDAALLDLGTVPVQDGAQHLVDHITGLVDAHDGKKRRASDRAGLRRAVGAVVGAALRSWRKGEAVFHPRDSKAFTGELVSHRPFIAAVKGMAALGLLHTKLRSNRPFDWGDGEFTFTGLAARVWPTDQLAQLATEHGITPDTVREAFDLEFSTVAPDVPAQLIEQRPLTAPRRGGRKAIRAGQRLSITPDDEDAQRLSLEVLEVNQFVAGQEVQGCLPPRFKRVFGPSWLLGGRWYALGGSGRFQALPKARRAAITINGEGTAEVDIRASHLSILLGLLGRELPDDPYELVTGFPRDVVKRWVTASIGKGSPVKRWPERALKEQPELAGVDARAVMGAAVACYDFMAAPAEWVAGPARLHDLAELGPPSRLLAARLMGIEGEAVTAAMDYLRQVRGVLALPVHDSLIAPQSQAKRAAETLQLAFHGRAGVAVRTRIEGGGG